MNNLELKNKIHTAVDAVLKEKNYIAPVELLMRIGTLSAKDYENWRLRHVPYLEKVCDTNLNKLMLIMKELRIYSRQKQLKPSFTAYYQWGVKGRKIPLQFSKSGDANLEEAYATHFVNGSNRSIEADWIQYD